MTRRGETYPPVRRGQPSWFVEEKPDVVRHEEDVSSVGWGDPDLVHEMIETKLIEPTVLEVLGRRMNSIDDPLGVFSNWIDGRTIVLESA